ncbi:hypothetical protein BC826DRAFT_64262 [Russula brevipes]|nr:hypothetical protein BC826DRAFT_64262 [Russula brevipes]
MASYLGHETQESRFERVSNATGRYLPSRIVTLVFRATAHPPPLSRDPFCTAPPCASPFVPCTAPPCAFPFRSPLASLRLPPLAPRVSPHARARVLPLASCRCAHLSSFRQPFPLPPLLSQFTSSPFGTTLSNTRSTPINLSLVRFGISRNIRSYVSSNDSGNSLRIRRTLGGKQCRKLSS